MKKTIQKYLKKNFRSGLIIIVVICIISQANLVLGSNKYPEYLNSSFFNSREEYLLSNFEKDKVIKSKVVIDKKDYQGNTCIFVVTYYDDNTRTIILNNKLSLVRAYIEKDGVIVKEMVNVGKEIIIKENNITVKKYINSDQKCYILRESVETVLRGFNFKENKRFGFNIISFDKDEYLMEIRVLAKEKIKSVLGEFECYKVLTMPGGFGKIFATKYKNYYYFTVNPPHYYIKYYNDFMPLTIEVTGLYH